jgi:hypothetical protein
MMPTNSQLVLAVVRPGDRCTNLRIRECTAIPPLALNGTLGHLCRSGKLERIEIDGVTHYQRPGMAA